MARRRQAPSRRPGRRRGKLEVRRRTSAAPTANRRERAMRGLAWAGATLALALLAGAARADRVPSFKVEVQPQHGVRPDIRVPYLTDGYSNLIRYGRVEPFVYGSPIVDDRANPQSRPVYNLPFY